MELWRSNYRLECAVIARRGVRVLGGLRPARRPQNLCALVEPLQIEFSSFIEPQLSYTTSTCVNRAVPVTSVIIGPNLIFFLYASVNSFFIVSAI